MTTPTYAVFDGDIANGVNPRRPSINDVGGAGKLDHQKYPPDPITMPTAADENQQERLHVGIASVSPVAIVQVTISGGTPTVGLVSAPSTVLVSADFTPIDNGAGDTTVTCPATKLPTSLGVCMPVILQDGDTTVTVVPVANGFRVRTRTGGTLTDCNYALIWY